MLNLKIAAFAALVGATPCVAIADEDNGHLSTATFELPIIEVATMIGALCTGLGFETDGKEHGRMTFYEGNLTCMVNLLGEGSMDSIRSVFGLTERGMATKHVVYVVTEESGFTSVEMKVRLAVLDYPKGKAKSYFIELPIGLEADKLETYIAERISP